MEYIRLVHPRSFNRERREFDDLAFKKSSGGGMSIFEVECATAASGLICEHIRKFYPHVAGQPAVFCRLQDADFPDGAHLIESLSDRGDDCHRELDRIGNGALKRHFRAKRAWENFFICSDEGARKLEEADLDTLG
jgi:hypothetical protein